MTVDGPDKENNSTATDVARYFPWAILATCVLGVVLRVLHLDVPMRYDESVTYLSYASQGWEHVTNSYQSPNNHVFHSLLVAWLTALLGDDPWVIRLPAFVAGCALVPAAAWVGRRAGGRQVALVAASIVATWPLLIEFSINARGYSIISLCALLAVGVGYALLEGSGWIAWLAWVELGAIGLYTIPTMAIPWLGLTVWLAWELARRAEPSQRLRAVRPLVLATAAVGLVAAALYSGIVRNEGMAALVGNRFVEPEPMRSFVEGTPREVATILLQVGRGVPLVLSGVLVGLVLWGVRSAPARGPWRGLLGSVALTVLAAMLFVRNWGEPRIWQWMVPLVAVTAAMGAGALGVTAMGGRAAPRLRGHWGAAVASLWAVVLTVLIGVADPVRTSSDTGAFPEVEAVLEAIVVDYRLGDVIVADFVSVEVLRFYMQRWAAVNDLAPSLGIDRAWVVVDGGDPERADEVHALLASMGAPPLADLLPVRTVGEVSLYLLGRPEAG